MNSTVNGNYRYIVDISGGLPTILCEVEITSGSITNKYYYADAQILKQDQLIYNQGQLTDIKPYFYIHDRLGSVRLVVDENGAVQNSYTYDPFGQDLSAADCAVNVYNPFKFTGQWFDDEISQYYLRARMYDPALMRFTDRDPESGKFQSPLSLHKYLYCQNDPLNRADPSGRISNLVNGIITGYGLYGHGLDLACYAVSSGDDRFWKLAEVTFNFMPYGMAIAAVAPINRYFGDTIGGIINSGIWFLEGTFETIGRQSSGYGWSPALAIDPLAFGIYMGVMAYTQAELGIDEVDFENYIDSHTWWTEY